MNMNNPIRYFLDAFVAWASNQPDVQGVALVGSQAHGTAKEDSDIDLVILTDKPRKYLDEVQWTKHFGVVEKHETEEYGQLTSSRIWMRGRFDAGRASGRDAPILRSFCSRFASGGWKPTMLPPLAALKPPPACGPTTKSGPAHLPPGMIAPRRIRPVSPWAIQSGWRVSWTAVASAR